jgi:hypothetical protein
VHPKKSGSVLLVIDLFRKSKNFIVWLCCDMDDGYIILAIFACAIIFFARNVPIWK